ncbi:hypothetical protein AAHN97_15105 [Chitinophaga niabensis]|uniref:hypothetical protein n=1 Tax=Chitinophaga niabensis TaxID=536979 RepID=UPI0031BAE255
MKLLKSKRVIFGCELRGDHMTPYLTRYTLIECKNWQLCLHVFHRSDWEDALHDHPWNFVSLLLWRGYTEHTLTGKRRYYPGSVLVRPASHIHRVEIPAGKKAISLVWMGKRKREWGFVVKDKWGYLTWTSFLKYFIKNKC